MVTTARQKWVDFVSRYYGDADYAKQVDADPTAELRKAGIPVPEGKKINLVKNSESTLHCILPSSPEILVLDDLNIYGGCCVDADGNGYCC